MVLDVWLQNNHNLKIHNSRKCLHSVLIILLTLAIVLWGRMAAKSERRQNLGYIFTQKCQKTVQFLKDNYSNVK